MNLEQTYELIKARIPKTQQIDSLDVVKQVEQYRQFWKPEKASVFLLAESHVYTSDEEFNVCCDKPMQSRFIMNYPAQFVRFVYCLGYGESEILNKDIEKNSGTWQYWEIFSSCVAKNYRNLGFQNILKGKTSLLQRLRNKVNVLQEMKRRGIWLLDASIVGIAGTVTDFKIKEKIISTCWDAYLQKVIIDSKPKHIIVIGKGNHSVEGILKWRIELLKASLGLTYSVLYQPQGIRGDPEKQLENYREFQRICSKYVIDPDKQ
jgi:hypothetical protein